MTKRERFTCVLVGTESLLIRCAEILLERGHPIAAICSSSESIGKWSAGKSIPWMRSASELCSTYTPGSVDYLFSITNLTVLSAQVLALARRGAINFHDGPLPRYAGLNAPAWALLEGERVHGVTWHLMTEAVDGGDILAEERFDIAENDTSLALNLKCFEVGTRSFETLLRQLEAGEARARRQAGGERRYYGKHARPTAACALAWNQSAEHISALVRALDYGPYRNPFGLPKLLIGHHAVAVRSVTVTADASAASPGTITALGPTDVRVATTTQDVLIGAVTTLEGTPLAIGDLAQRLGLRAGIRLPVLETEAARRWSELDRGASRQEEYWVGCLAQLEPLELPWPVRPSPGGGAPGDLAVAPLSIPPEAMAFLRERAGPREGVIPLLTALGAYFGRLAGKRTFDVGLFDRDVHGVPTDASNLFATLLPLRFDLTRNPAFEDLEADVAAGVRELKQRGTYARDLIARAPELASRRGADPTAFPILFAVDDGVRSDALTIRMDTAGSRCEWIYDRRQIEERTIAGLQRQCATFLVALAGSPDRPVAALPLLTTEEERQILFEWNATARDYPRDCCIHDLVERQVARTPDATAVVCGEVRLTYRELNARANQLARHLRRVGVGRETRVGVCFGRSADMLVSVLAVLKAGGAFVPIDPLLPGERVTWMVEDSGLTVFLTQAQVVAQLPSLPRATTVWVDADWSVIARESPANLDAHDPHGLAYVMYTSGSTGTPKGVMVEHCNVLNCFAGMDDRIAHEPSGVWLAVTSLSFDISVLELFWPLTKGFTVVIHREGLRSAVASRPRAPSANRKMDFSLFYFASDEIGQGPEKYHLLLEGARFADRHGFAAVWTPERHFHAFGGLYPNPSVTSAALAAITTRVGIRAGSCVLPLHHPIRVVEEWSLVDNLSNGRVGVSFASGWQPDDFVLRPEQYAGAKEAMVRDIDVVRRLWRGEAVAFPGPKGTVAVRTLPRPVQPELPFWITSAGSPETFRLAGRLGANVLTHLLGQTVVEVADKLRVYRDAWQEAGHPGAGHVTLMLHTFVASDPEFVRAQVREPLKAYLRSSASLLKQYASTFPAFKAAPAAVKETLDEEFRNLSREDLEGLLEHSFGRYFETSGLFGTPEGCVGMVDRLKEIGVDEIACLVDFGVPNDVALQHLTDLDRLRELANGAAETRGTDDDSVADLIRRHGVTHFQCTPSLASSLTSDPGTRLALGSLRHVLVGGEAFPPALAAELRSLVGGELLNVYGPTETTIWSTAYAVDGIPGPVPIGRPIANTQLYVLDASGHPVPIGVPGELFIGGEGVARGYLDRPQLTAERFVPHPLRPDAGSRLYRTGDLVRYREDGCLEFLGRVDQQVKIRGHRVEPGEIESVLAQHRGVQAAVVAARDDAARGTTLVAYYVQAPTASISGEELRSYLATKLPDHMVPALFVRLAALPLTPNGKVDRRALPAPQQARADVLEEAAAPSSAVEKQMAQIWCELLGLEQVSVHDNFFDLGGHSLLAVAAITRIHRVLGRRFAPLDFARQTLGQLAAVCDQLPAAEPRSVPLLRRAVRAFKTGVLGR